MRVALPTLILAARCWSQASSGGLIGDITDAGARQLSNVSITVQHGATGFSRSVTSDSHGGYRIEDLLPGEYTVIVNRAGFRTVTVSRIAVEVDRKTRLDSTLQAGAESDQVAVTGDSSSVEIDSAADGYQLGSGVVAALPLDSGLKAGQSALAVFGAKSRTGLHGCGNWRRPRLSSFHLCSTFPRHQ